MNTPKHKTPQSREAGSIPAARTNLTPSELRNLGSSAAAELVKISPREREVWRRVALAEPSKQIAQELGISTKTVDHHRESLFRKLGVNNAIHATHAAIRHGVITIEVLP